MLNAVSLGGGVQSTVMTLLAAEGRFGPVPDVAIWADTGWDPPSVRATVEWVAGQVPFDVEIVSAGNLAEDTRMNRSQDGAEGLFAVPAFVEGGMTRRYCTTQYKIRPIIKELRRRCGYARYKHIPKGSASQWLGISLDEHHRMKPARDVWIENRWPLVEARMTRTHCRQWWDANAPQDAPPLGRSSCVGCPYHSTTEWLELSDKQPHLIADAAQIEAELQSRQGEGFKTPYLHRRRVPLLQAIELDRAAADNQQSLDALWGEECEGMCGV